jgi:hypothetical protein
MMELICSSGKTQRIVKRVTTEMSGWARVMETDVGVGKTVIQNATKDHAGKSNCARRNRCANVRGITGVLKHTKI